MTSTRQMIITLVAVALMCSVVLSFVYSYTAPRIEDTKNKLMLSGLREVIEATEFQVIIPDTVWLALDSLGEKQGIVFRVFPQGYSGPIPIMVGLDCEGVITGIRIASAAEGMGETPGLGAKILEDGFKSQFIGKTGNAVLLVKDGGEIDGITAATISSRAVCNGIKKGIECYRAYTCELFDPLSIFPAANDLLEIVKDTLWYAIMDSDTIGLVFFSSTQGYSDRIDFACALNQDAKIIMVKVLYANETPGVGDVIQTDAFLEKFKTGFPDAVSGATISCTALIQAVRQNIERYKEYLQ